MTKDTTSYDQTIGPSKASKRKRAQIAESRGGIPTLTTTPLTLDDQAAVTRASTSTTSDQGKEGNPGQGRSPLGRTLSSKESNQAQRNASHVATEQRRRDRINERFAALREIVPHNEKNDKASFLLEVIDYIKRLQSLVSSPQVAAATASVGAQLGVHPGMVGFPGAGLGEVPPFGRAGAVGAAGPGLMGLGRDVGYPAAALAMPVPHMSAPASAAYVLGGGPAPGVVPLPSASGARVAVPVGGSLGSVLHQMSSMANGRGGASPTRSPSRSAAPAPGSEPAPAVHPDRADAGPAQSVPVPAYSRLGMAPAAMPAVPEAALGLGPLPGVPGMDGPLTSLNHMVHHLQQQQQVSSFAAQLNQQQQQQQSENMSAFLAGAAAGAAAQRQQSQGDGAGAGDAAGPASALLATSGGGAMVGQQLGSIGGRAGVVPGASTPASGWYPPLHPLAGGVGGGDVDAAMMASGLLGGAGNPAALVAMLQHQAASPAPPVGASSPVSKGHPGLHEGQ